MASEIIFQPHPFIFFSVHRFPLNLPFGGVYCELLTTSLMVSVYEATRCYFPEKSNVLIHCGVKLRIHRIIPIRNSKGLGYSGGSKAVREHALKAYGRVGVYLHSFVMSTLSGRLGRSRTRYPLSKRLGEHQCWCGLSCPSRKVTVSRLHYKRAI